MAADFGIGIRDPLFFVGAIEDIEDPRKEGRVRVRAFGIHGTPNSGIRHDDLPWAIVVTGDYKAASALNLSINQWVFGMFLDGRHAQQPIVLGLIPTQYLEDINPEANGWGYIPKKDGDLTAKASKPENVGQPDMPREARGEDLTETAVFDMSMGRTRNVKIGGSEAKWDEPAPAYAAQYPHNKVISTGVHTVELDETPGAERILIYHKSGSYVQMDTRGTTTEKSVSDKFEVIDRAQHVFVGNASTVTINGNAHVYVKGNKIEEIQGDYQQIVHGNYYLGVGGPDTIINGSTNLQMRAGQVKVEANAGYMSLLAKKETQMQAGEGIQIQAPKIFNYSSDQYLVKSDNLFAVEATKDVNFKSRNAFLETTTNINLKAAANMRLMADTTNGQISVKAKTVAIDEYVTMANGTSIEADESVSVSRPDGMGTEAAKVEAPEPPEQGTNVNTSPDKGSMGSTGAASQDSAGSVDKSITTPSSSEPPTAALRNNLTPLLEFIAYAEMPKPPATHKGYNQMYGAIKDRDYPPKPLVEMTIQEILDYQESIDKRFNSEAAGIYQIMEDTLRGYNNNRQNPPREKPLYEKAGLTAGDLFNEMNQDLMAVQLMRRRGLEDYLEGKINEYQFANKLAYEWASLPFVSGSDRGRSAYDGVAGNSARVSVQAFLEAVRAVKKKNDDSKQVENLPDPSKGVISI